MRDPERDVESGLEWLLPGVRAKGNGLIVVRAAEDGRLVPFERLRVRLRQPRDSRLPDRHRTQP
jgi:hypothetical protein